MAEESVRLGGMALQNGVLVHGPTSWGVAVRDRDGALHVAAGRKPYLAPMARKRIPILRGPILLADAFALLPMVRRAVPQAKFPFERPSVLVSILGTALVARSLRRSRLSASARELTAAGVAFVPAAMALRGPDLAAYHGAEHISIGTYENGGTPAPKEHPRCGSQLIAPMVASSIAANVVASKAPSGTRGLVRVLGTVAAVGGSVELFSWVARNPANRLAQLLARPGFELQRHLSTAEPSGDQLAVANAARDACLELERQPA
ncbi:MAG TPA: DUF1385 domain-containing protein [Gaiellaceae bacterium]|nr:DUF1385 domain-containing protein [Gaiellaceae bacterium]